MIKPIKPEVFQMEISGLKQTLRITKTRIIAELHYDDGEKTTGIMGGKIDLRQFIAYTFTFTHKHGKASSIEAFLDAVATRYLQGKLF